MSDFNTILDAVPSVAVVHGRRIHDLEQRLTAVHEIVQCQQKMIDLLLRDMYGIPLKNGAA